MTAKRAYIAAVAAAMMLSVAEALPAQVAAPSNTPEDNIIVEIRVQGNRQLSEKAVRTRIRVRVGQPYDPELVKLDQQLLSQSRRFDSVRVEAQKAPEGGVILTFIVIERPLVKAVTFVGNKKLKTEDLRKELEFSAGDPVDRNRISRGRQALQERYRQSGFRDASVTIDEQALTARNEVRYLITEGPQTTIRKIEFPGNTFFPAIKLRFDISSSVRFWPFVDGYLDMEKVDEDVNTLRNLYIDEGFLDAEVGREIVFLTADKTKAKILFHINQGPRYRINEIRFRGNKVFSDAELAKRLELHRGSFFTKELHRRDVKAVQDSYGQLGFVDARVESVHQYMPPGAPLPAWAVKLDKGKPALVNLLFTIVEDDQFTVGKVIIRGNTVTQDRVIRRNLRFFPQQLYNTMAVEDSRRVLQESGLFEPNSVAITPVPAGDHVRDAVVTVKEGATAQFMVGVGYSTNDGLVGDITFVQRNFDIRNPGGWEDVKRNTAWKGAGQTFRINIRPGTELNTAAIEWYTPFIGDLPTSYGAKVFLFDRERESYTETRGGFVHSIGKYFPNDWRADLINRIEGVDIHSLDHDAPDEVRDDKGTSLVVGLKGKLTRDRSDSRYLPSKGDKLQVSYEQVTGSYNFGVAEADYRYYYTLGQDQLDRKHILATRVAAGQIIGDAPVFEKFYGGGIGSVRGFKYRGISPRSGPDHDPIGGDFMFFLGTEYTFPLIGEQLRGVLFLDTGTVDESASFSHYRAAVGPGIRWVIPLFGQVPLDLDLGFPILKSDHDDTQIFSFSMGVTF